jgi:hypothetical protein
MVGEGDEGGEVDEGIATLRKYWNDRLEEFERVIYPVFYVRGYSKNTALLVAMLDELDDALMVAAATRQSNP